MQGIEWVIERARGRERERGGEREREREKDRERALAGQKGRSC